MPAAIIAVLGVAYGPLLVEHFRNLWLKSHYQYYPFALAAFAVLLALRLQEATPRTESNGLLNSAAVVALGSVSWLLLAAAYVGYSPWLAAISAAMLVAAV